MAAAKKSKSKATIDQSRPFMGLRSFEEKNKSQFGGRDKEIASLYRLVEDHNLTVVYGTSGIGKTSILKAGLMPELRQNFYYPIYIRIDFSSSKPPFDQLRDHLFQHMNQLDSRVEKMETKTIWEYLHQVKLLDGLVIPVLIFDQFEEIFTLGKNKKGIKEFVTELANLSQNRIPASVKSSYAKQGKTVPSRFNKLSFRIVISLREDYLPRLDELKNYIPSILDNGFRVVQMSIAQAMEAAIKPGKGLIDKKAAEAIIKKLPGISQADFDVLNEKGKQKKKLKVEPFLLSLICQRLNEQRIRNQLNSITIDLIKKFKVDDIISSFYNETVDELRPEVDIAIQELLLDADGYRKLDALKEFQDEYTITDKEVNRLIDARIIRKESRNNVEYLELIHDVLAPVIKKKRNSRKRKEKEAAKDEENRVKTRKRRQLIVFVIAGAVLIGGLIGLYIWQNFKEKQSNIWEFAKKTNTESGFKKFREIFPKSDFEDEAINKIDSLLIISDAKNWEGAQNSNSLGSYKHYRKNAKKNDSVERLAKIPIKRYFNQIKEHIKSADDSIASKEKEESIDRKAWIKAHEDEKTFNAYVNYIMSQNNPKIQNNIPEAVQAIRKPELGIDGWLFAGNLSSHTKMNYSENKAFFKILWSQGKHNSNGNSVPREGDIIQAIESRNTYHYLQNINQRNKRNRPAWQENRTAYVLDAIVDGRALFLKIVYEK